MTDLSRPKTNRPRWPRLALTLVLVTVYLLGAALAAVAFLHGDEWVHVAQARRYAVGDFRFMSDYLTTLPGWHLLVGGWLALFDSQALWLARMPNVFAAVLTVWLFGRAARRLHPQDEPGLRMAQFAVLPFLVPLVFQVYTDVPALGLVLAGLLACHGRRDVLALLCLLAAMGVRQTSVYWLVVAGIYALWQERHWLAAPHLGKLIFRLWPYVLGASVFVGFWFWNGGVSMSSVQAPHHPDFKLSLGNPLLLLFAFALLMPGQALMALIAQCRNSKTEWAYWLAPLAAVLAYLFGFEVDHAYNLIPGNYSLRNSLLQATQQNPWASAGFAGGVGLGALLIARTPLAIIGRSAWFAASVGFLSLSWLIEQRYLLLPLGLWLLLRSVPDGAVTTNDTRTRRVALEWATLLYWALASVALLIGNADYRFGL